MRKMSGGNFVFIFFLIFMVYRSFQSGTFDNPGQWLLLTLLKLPALVVGITFHEFAHAYSAYKLGDQTPKAQKRVTLNPLSHIDPIGIIALVFIGFGWGRPVQINPYAFQKNRRLSSLIVSVAGVVTNFVIAFLCTGLILLTGNYPFLTFILVFVVYFNLVLMLFNLLPIPPLDGFGILTEIFDLRRFSWYQTFYNNGMIILLVIIVFGIVGLLLGSALFSLLGFLGKIWDVDLNLMLALIYRYM